MKGYFQVVGLILFALLLVACSASSPAMPEATPTAADSSQDFHPLTTRTGIEGVDNLLEVVASGDAQALRALIQFTSTRCTTAEGLGGPPKCREAEAEGTPVEVLPIFGTEGHFFHKENIEDWPGVPADGLYTIYEVSREVVSDPDYPSGRYAAMFVDQKNQAVISLRVADGRIVRVDYLLDDSPEQLRGWIEREASNVILAPPQQ